MSSAVVSLQFSCISYLHLWILLLFCHSSLHFFFHLSHFRRIVSVSPINCFLLAFSYSLSCCQFSRLPRLLERWACVSQVYSMSGTFQLACIPASGCVGDKMEQIPPSYCYLCFPPVTHTHTNKHTSSHVRIHMTAQSENAGVLAPSAADAQDR